MLRNTFQHIPGVGERWEKRLWSSGCRSWDDFLRGDFCLPERVCRRVEEGVVESSMRLKSLDNIYFREVLPSAITWRAYPDFMEYACFIDIETTGLVPYHSYVTTVCVHSLRGTEVFIRHRNLEELGECLSKFKFIVSFNGARFDLPFLSSDLGLCFDQIHLDLVYPLRRLGLCGGLKSIERVLGIPRDTSGVTGWDAVRLWRAYSLNRVVEVAGRSVSGEKALDLLVEYNREDALVLKRLADYCFEELRRVSGFS